MATIEVVGMAEAADIVGVSKSNFSAHRKQFGEDGQCPPATAQLKSGPVWAGSDVKALRTWAKEFAKIRVTRPGRADAAPAKDTKAKATKSAPAKAAAPAKKAAAKKAAAPKAEAAPKVEAPAKKAASKKAAPAAKAESKKGLFGKKDKAGAAA